MPCIGIGIGTTMQNFIPPRRIRRRDRNQFLIGAAVVALGIVTAVLLKPVMLRTSLDSSEPASATAAEAADPKQ